jgi:hypothetical protein
MSVILVLITILMLFGVNKFGGNTNYKKPSTG